MGKRHVILDHCISVSVAAYRLQYLKGRLGRERCDLSSPRLFVGCYALGPDRQAAGDELLLGMFPRM